MNTEKPDAVCECGYPLLEGQTCPECGRPYRALREESMLPRFTCVVSVIAGLLFAVPFGLFYLGHWRYPHNTEAALFSALIPAALSWLASVVFAVVGSTSAIVLWHKDLLWHKENRSWQKKKIAHPVTIAISLLVCVPILLFALFIMVTALTK